MIIKLAYKFISKVYSEVSTLLENLVLIKKKINVEKPLFRFKNLQINNIDFENFEKINHNKYLVKYIFPEKIIYSLIHDLFNKNDLANKITNLTGFNYSLNFFIAYRTYKLSEDDKKLEWYANDFHKDKPYSKNMVKILFSFEEIGTKNGPMIIRDKENYNVTINRDEVVLFFPNKYFHKASSPDSGSRFQMMFQLIPSKEWRINNKIFIKQRKIEPKFPFFSYFFDKKTDLKNLNS